MNFLKRIKSAGAILGVVSFVLGLVLMFRPVQTQVFLNTLVGICLLVMGLSKLVQQIALKKEIEEFKAIMSVFPILICALGLFVLVNPKITTFTIGIIISVFALILSIDRIMVANNRRKMGAPYGATIIFGVVQFLFSIIMFYNAFATMTAIVMLAGIYLIVNGIMIFSSSMLIKDL